MDSHGLFLNSNRWTIEGNRFVIIIFSDIFMLVEARARIFSGWKQTSFSVVKLESFTTQNCILLEVDPLWEVHQQKHHTLRLLCCSLAIRVQIWNPPVVWRFHFRKVLRQKIGTFGSFKYWESLPSKQWCWSRCTQNNLYLFFNWTNMQNS